MGTLEHMRSGLSKTWESVADGWRALVEREQRRGRFQIMERAYGRFERALRLPAAVDDACAESRYERGVLRIHIPRSAPVEKVRRIEVSRA